MPKSIYYKGGLGASLAVRMLAEPKLNIKNRVSVYASVSRAVADHIRWSDGCQPLRVVSLAIDTEIEQGRGDNRV